MESLSIRYKGNLFDIQRYILYTDKKERREKEAHENI